MVFPWVVRTSAVGSSPIQTDVRRITTLIAVTFLTGCACQSTRPPRQATELAAPIFLFQPITVTVVSTNQLIFVGGEVRQPGRFVWSDGLTVTNVIAMAGGFTDFANRSRLEIRRSDGTQERYSYGRILSGLTNNPPLKPNDQIVVPKRFW